MNIEEYLKKYQPTPYKLFKNVLEKNNFFHAYLLSGPKGSSLNKISKFLGKSLLCSNSTFACLNCNTCLRVEKETYGDFKIFNAKNSSLKVNDVRENIEEIFSKTAQEIKGIKIYVIDNVDYLSAQSINALLKFLEEPPKNTYAIFTTENENLVLETIKSRCQIVRFNMIKKNEFVKLATQDNIKITKPFLYASLISNYYDEIIELINAEDFINVTSLITEYLKRMIDYNSLRFFVESKIIPFLNTKTKFYYFYDIFLALLKETISYKNNSTITFIDLKEDLNLIKNNILNLTKSSQIILNDEYNLKNNFNISLLILHSLTEIFKV